MSAVKVRPKRKRLKKRKPAPAAKQPTVPTPTLEDIMLWDEEGMGEAIDGCEAVELDGTCVHGYPCWVKYLNLV